MKKGLFITFEGIEGSGKSTQAAVLAERLKNQGYDVVTTREPGGTATGEAIRGILQYNETNEHIFPEAEVMLFAAGRAQHVRGIILPALEQGRYVICDRFADSTTAYQGYGRCFDVEKMISINDFAICGLLPDITFLLDVDAETGLSRIAERNKKNNSEPDRIESEKIEFHKRVRAGYMELAQRWPDRFRVIDAVQDEQIIADKIYEECLSQRH
jgi:dTMP kinase